MELKTKEMNAEESQNARNTTALENSSIGVFEFEPSSQLCFWDDRVRKLWGASADQLIDYEFVLSKMHPDDHDMHNQATMEALDPAGSGEMDVRYRLVARDDQPETWIRAVASCRFENGVPIRLVGTVHDVTDEMDAKKRRELLLRELQHRLKNTIAVVSAITEQSRQLYSTVDEFADAMSARLRALAHAQDILQEHGWQDVLLSQICQNMFATFSGDASRLKMRWDEDILISENYVLTATLAIYELTSNSLKYGSLGKPDGYVLVTGERVDGMPVFRWEEHGVPGLAEDELAETGFGSFLLRYIWPGELQASSSYRGTPEGVLFELKFDKGARPA